MEDEMHSAAETAAAAVDVDDIDDHDDAAEIEKIIQTASTTGNKNWRGYNAFTFDCRHD